MTLKNSIFLCFSVILFFSCKTVEENSISVKPKPNIIYILADDLGYGDLGVYGQEKIETPNIDAIAKEGIMFTNHYSSAPVCSPARNMLLTGKHAGHAAIRGNDDWGERGDIWDYAAVEKDSTLEGDRPMPESTITFASKLQEVGYKTSMFGKWGLGAPNTNSIPIKMGFDYFVGYNCQRQAHTYYPMHLYKNERRFPLNNEAVYPHAKLASNFDPYNSASYIPYTLNEYAPDIMFNQIQSFVSENKKKPFFIYWATPIPHVPLQVPQRWVDYYIKKFGTEEPYIGQKGYFPHKNPHAAYAAMISYLDENIGKLIKQLKEEGIYDNTLIVFTSDNGPTYNGGSDSEWFDSAKPFKSTYGYGKGFLNEGGIRVPMIASWPGHIKPGIKTNHISAQYDVFATLSDLTGFHLAESNDGISFLPTLLSKKNQKEHEFLYWEFPEYEGQVAIRMGKWKVIRKNLNSKSEVPTLELYNLETDSIESINVAHKHPEIINKAAKIFRKEHTEPEIKKFRIPLLKNGLLGDKTYK